MPNTGSTERAAQIGWMLARGERIEPRRVAARLGVTPRAIKLMLTDLARVLPMLECAGVWFAEDEMVKEWEILKPTAVPPDSALGRRYEAWQAADGRERAAHAAVADVRTKYAETLKFLAEARLGSVQPAQFAEETARAELLRRELPALEVAQDQAGRRAAERKEEFGAAYRRYRDAHEARSKAVLQGNLENIRVAETRILAMLATDGSLPGRSDRRA